MEVEHTSKEAWGTEQGRSPILRKKGSAPDHQPGFVFCAYSGMDRDHPYTVFELSVPFCFDFPLKSKDVFFRTGEF